MKGETDLEKRIRAIESRNARVELDKAWETSVTRRVAIAGLTYLVIVIYLFVIKHDAPFINALVPAFSFFLSTLILGGLKNWWQDRQK